MDLLQTIATQTFRWFMDDGPSKMMTSMRVSQAKKAEEERKRQEAASKPDRDAFALAIEEERKRILAEDERVRSLSEEDQRKLAAEILLKHLPDRISEIDARLGKIEQNLKKKEAALAKAVAKQESAIAEQKEFDEKMARFKKSAKDAVRLNAFYREYLAACGNSGKLDDIGEFMVRSAAQKGGVTSDEIAAVSEFAVAHGFNKDEVYMSAPVKPAVVDKREEISRLNEEVEALTRSRDEISEMKNAVTMVKLALQRRMPTANSDESGQANLS